MPQSNGTILLTHGFRLITLDPGKSSNQEHLVPRFAPIIPTDETVSMGRNV